VKLKETDKYLDEIRHEKGFLNFAPDLRKTPNLPVIPPKNLDEVQKRLRSVRQFLRFRRDVDALSKLSRKVYNPRVQKFDWNIQEIPEMNGSYTPENRKLITAETGMSDEEEEEIDAEDLSAPMNDYEYKEGYFVAVINEDEEDGHLEFWIARIKEVQESPEGVAEELNIVWYEAEDNYGRTNPIDKKYQIAKKRGKAWEGIVSVDSVCATFDSLKPSGVLYANTKKAITSSMASFISS